MSDYRQVQIGFIGGGNMAQAIIRGLLTAGHDANSIAVAEPAESQQQAIAGVSDAIEITGDNASIAAASEMLVLAVKPQVMPEVCQALGDADRKQQQTIVSVAAGITLDSLAGWFGADSSIVRVMPNQPALISEGMSGLCAGPSVSDTGRQHAAYLMEATGKTAWFGDEGLMDAVTAISGSGPAYFYLVMEILQEVAEEFGFDAGTARLLSTQTGLGASRVASEDSESLATLRDQVTSPGGTTDAALTVLEDAGIRDMFRRALIAARDRSVELGKHKGND
ncbi:MAG: pyrroline-5-carboxylate reductase [Gammaproteobacteria bacterium]|jgi:pyrroline-5-carboxylate reductase|nr:pyrroline-5-carboxylate reductase [Gammaproteobacteria bacterium]MDP7093830.1 pyrroline-5-carboxylate reductase [Gammaproteobacteria bacterium]MDP7270455.1 pyrroline-5-carboxylate reductase [Gammaproteobacteria bacterium]HJP05278.1 pyrroline-5-carboxylate reductase [Gammaproteobacteria bacterium]